MKAHGPRGWAPAFVQVLAGYVARTAREAGLTFAPAGGVDIANANPHSRSGSPAGCRSASSKGRASTSVGAGVGLVFGVGNR